MWKLGTVLFGADAYVVADTAPFVIKKAALAAKATLGDRVQICDGVADEREVRAAIDALSSVGGKILFSAGQFNISSSITINKDWVNFEGSGVLITKLKLTDGANCDVITGDGTQQLGTSVGRLTIDGNKANNPTGGHGIRGHYLGYGTAHPNYYDLHITQCKNKGLYVSDTGTHQSMAHGHNVVVTDCSNGGVYIIDVDFLVWTGMNLIMDNDGIGFQLAGSYGDHELNLYCENNNGWGFSGTDIKDSIIRLYSHKNANGVLLVNVNHCLMDLLINEGGIGLRLQEVDYNQITLGIRNVTDKAIHCQTKPCRHNSIMGYIEASNYGLWFADLSGSYTDAWEGNRIVGVVRGATYPVHFEYAADEKTLDIDLTGYSDIQRDHILAWLGL